MLLESLLADLVADLPAAVRLQRLVHTLREHFRCGAVVLLRLQDGQLVPVAAEGLMRDAIGRRFAVAQHPRLAAILARREPTRFEPGSELPDPYDGLLDALPEGRPLPVHDCMGVSLHIEGEPWGALTLDSLQVDTFDAVARETLGRAVLLVEAAVRVSRLEEEVRGLRLARQEPAAAPAVTLARDAAGDDIVAQHPRMRDLLHEIDVVADSGLPVLLLGETGVGKELFAARLHRLSSRRARALVHVNCSALPESLAESELFGHVKGAFSGATHDRPGRFDAADGGTLFLDEVGELPLPVQAKLLRALQEGEIQRLGADRPLRVDVRIIAATNRNLREAVRDGSFRADLYHRLSVYPVPIPPLRERGNDILLLAGRFLEMNRARLGLRSLRLSADGERALLRYNWPGNVRELEHVIGRAALKALTRGASRKDIVTLEAELLDLDLEMGDALAAVPHAPLRASLHDGVAPGSSSHISHASLRETVEAAERQAIRTALAQTQGNWAQAARRLGVDASNLHKLARRLGIKGGSE